MRICKKAGKQRRFYKGSIILVRHTKNYKLAFNISRISSLVKTL